MKPKYVVEASTLGWRPGYVARSLTYEGRAWDFVETLIHEPSGEPIWEYRSVDGEYLHVLND